MFVGSGKDLNDTLKDVKEAEDNRAYVREIELVLMRTLLAAGIPFLASKHNRGFFNGPAGFRLLRKKEAKQSKEKQSKEKQSKAKHSEFRRAS